MSAKEMIGKLKELSCEVKDRELSHKLFTLLEDLEAKVEILLK